MIETIEKNEVIISLAKEVLDIEGKCVLSLKERINASFIEAIKILYECKGRVIVSGMGKSGLIGKKIAATLSSTGTPAYFLHPAESTHGDSGIITREDTLIAISNSGETTELLNLMPLIKRFNIKTIAMVGKTNSKLANFCDVTLDVSVEKEACPLNKAPTASTTATLAMGDALAICLLKKRGFTQEDFLLYHPSGALGKGILYKASDLMIQGDNLPLIDENTPYLETVKFICDKKLGTAVLIDKNGIMTGILTDGDIRRQLLKNGNLEIPAKDAMSHNPKTITPDDLAAKALSIMEKHSITSLVVVNNENKPVGILHIHDLLKAGVA